MVVAAVAAAETIDLGEIRTANVTKTTTITNPVGAIKARTTTINRLPHKASNHRAKLMPRTSGTTLASMRCSKMSRIDKVDNSLVDSNRLQRVASRAAKEAEVKVDTAMTEEKAKNEVATVGLRLDHQLHP